MIVVFYIASGVAILSTFLVILQSNAVHALLYAILSLLSVAIVFFSLGAPLVAALEVIVYAGAIMVLFVFVVMVLNLGPGAEGQERVWLQPRTWTGPVILTLVLIGELIYIFLARPGLALGGPAIGPQEVSLALYGPYLLGVELASILLLAGLVGAYHLGREPSD
ncbi:MAG: NADH dehydrogenase [Chloroflexi bacterium RBG_19FT_COMBO_62_14]|nr:MAG: NADH dehydrogenase [Chloroflexi bacterium RBG_19FT_COMBO_62_14]